MVGDCREAPIAAVLFVKALRAAAEVVPKLPCGIGEGQLLPAGQYTLAGPPRSKARCVEAKEKRGTEMSGKRRRRPARQGSVAVKL